MYVIVLISFCLPSIVVSTFVFVNDRNVLSLTNIFVFVFVFVNEYNTGNEYPVYLS